MHSFGHHMGSIMTNKVQSFLTITRNNRYRRIRCNLAVQVAHLTIDGNSLPQAPRWIANWTAKYGVPMGDGELYVFTDWSYRSKINFFLYESVEFQDGHQLEGGVRVGYKTDSFDVAAFVRNLTNDTSAVGAIDFNNLTGFVNEPRIWGVEAGFKF